MILYTIPQIILYSKGRRLSVRLDLYLQKDEINGNLFSKEVMACEHRNQRRYNNVGTTNNGGYQTEGSRIYITKGSICLIVLCVYYFVDSKKMLATQVVDITSDSTSKTQQQRRDMLNVHIGQRSYGEPSQGSSENYTRSRRRNTEGSSVEKGQPTLSYSTKASGGSGIGGMGGVGGVSAVGPEETGKCNRLSDMRNISPTGLCDYRLPNTSTPKQYHYSQMSATEKIRRWRCEDVTSDVEDGSFEKDYENFEMLKKQHIQELKENKHVKSFLPPKYIGKEEFKNYDFHEFQQKIMQQLQDNKLSNNMRRYGGSRTNIMAATTAPSKVKGRKSIEQISPDNTKELNNVDGQKEEDNLKQRHKPDAMEYDGNCIGHDTSVTILNNMSTSNNNSTRKTNNKRKTTIKAKTKNKTNTKNKNITNNTNDTNNTNTSINPFKDLSVFGVRGDHERKTTEAELANIFKLHQFSKPHNSSISVNNKTSTTKWKYPSKFRDAGENRLIEVHLDFEGYKKDINLVNKKKELFKSEVSKEASTATFVVKRHSPSEIQVIEGNDGVDYDEDPQYQGEEQEPEKAQVQPPAEKQGNENAHHEMEEMVEPIVTNDNEQGEDGEGGEDGVCHQQHEFCNYLGLTGMSTATAMANAVAELAQSNLTRRSLRVQRQQQKCQHKSIYTNDQHELMALKEKQLNEIKKTARDPLHASFSNANKLESK